MATTGGAMEAMEASFAARARGLGWLLWLALAASWLVTLQIRPLLDPDEGRYAEIPREMLASGDWVTPHLNGLKYFEKPPLQYWATSAAYSVCGESEWTARLWSVALAFLCLPMVYAWSRALYGMKAGLVALSALAVSPYFAIVGHLDLLDAGFTFWLTGAIFAFTLAQNAPTGSQSERRWMLVTWAAAALAVLSKGIVVGVLAGLTLSLYSLLERDIRPWKRLHAGLGIPLFVLIAAPWFVLVSSRNPEFLQFFFVHEHLARFLTTVHQRVEPWWYFLPVLLLGVLPWVGYVGGLARQAWFDPGLSPQFRPQKFLLLFALVTLVFFSLSGSKLAPYILPMMPVLAALAGVHAAARPDFIRHVSWFVAGLLVFCAIGMGVYSVSHSGKLPQAVLAWSTATAALGACAAILTQLRIAPARGVWLLCVASVLGWQCLLTAFAAVAPLRTAKELVAAISEEIKPQTPLYSVGQYRHTLTWYLRRNLVLVGFAGELEFGIGQEPGKESASRAEFLTRWRASADAVAFFAPAAYDDYRMLGLPGRVVVRDGTTVVVSRKEFPDVPAADVPAS